MSKYMRQVTKEEYEVLTRFHPGEIRYYVETTTWSSRRKGASITVKRGNGASPKKGKAKRKVRSPAVVGRGKANGSDRPRNSPMQLRNSAHEFKEGSLSINLYRLVRLQFQNDPTTIVGRTDLVENIVSSSVYAKNQVGPFVSDCVKKGILRYTGTTA